MAPNGEALVKFYDTNGKLLLTESIDIVHVPEILSIEPSYVIMDESQTFTLILS